MEGWVTPEGVDENGEPINRFATDTGLNGRTIFITGGTGFMGKVLIEKLLRTCPKIRVLYVLIRAKKGKTAQERLDEILAGPLYDLLRKTHGNEIIKKVVAIPGDVMELDLGLSPEHRKMIAEEANGIYHMAATIRFDDPLSKAVLLNVRGTKLMLEFAKEFKKLIVFSHISTAYCHLKERILYEKAYPPPADPHAVIRAVEFLGEELVNSIQHKLLGDYPNPYAFTKALGEALAVEQMDQLPIIILRPPVVIPIWKEPLPGWTDNINGPAGLLIGAGKGVIRTMYCDDQGYADFLPVDIAVNTLILTAGDYVDQGGVRRIYNCTSSHEYKITWSEIIELGRSIITNKMPLNGVVWYPGGSMKKSRLIHNICVVLFHYIPAIFLDTLIFLSGNKPVLWRVQQRVTKGFEVFEYYANKQWDFDNESSLKARALMNSKEKEIYKVDGSDLDIEEYFTNCIHCARLYILKESDESIPAARRHMKVMWVVDKITKFLLLIGFSYFLFNYVFYPLFNSD